MKLTFPALWLEVILCSLPSFQNLPSFQRFKETSLESRLTRGRLWGVVDCFNHIRVQRRGASPAVRILIQLLPEHSGARPCSCRAVIEFEV